MKEKNTIKAITVKSNTVQYNDVEYPTIVVDSASFEYLFNSIMVDRYIIEYSVKEESARRTAQKAREELAKYAKDTEEHKKASDSLKRATENEKAFKEVLKSLRTEKKENFSKDAKASETLAFSAILYSLAFSSAYAIDTEKNKVIPLYVNGVHNLYNACVEYNKQYGYTDKGTDWTAIRVEEFKAIKNQLVAIGARLDNDGEGKDLKKFKYSCTSKDVNSLLAYVFDYAKISTGSGKNRLTRNKIDNFQKVVVATIFRTGKTDYTHTFYTI